MGFSWELADENHFLDLLAGGGTAEQRAELVVLLGQIFQGEADKAGRRIDGVFVRGCVRAWSLAFGLEVAADVERGLVQYVEGMN